jgi:hypothetical protein
VRLRADATRVSSVSQQEKSNPNLTFPAFPVRLHKHVSKHISGRVSYLAGGSSDLHRNGLYREESRSHLFSAFLVSR